MGLFGWLADRWTPAYEYREYYGNEVEYIAWESTAVGSRRGFLLGFPAGALLTVAVIGGAVLTGSTPRLPPRWRRERDSAEATASQATTTELDALRAENQGLKKQVLEVNTASQATTKELAALREENQGLKKQVMEVNHRVAGHDKGAGRPAGREPGPEEASDGSEDRGVASHDKGAGRPAGGEPGPEEASDGSEPQRRRPRQRSWTPCGKRTRA